MLSSSVGLVAVLVFTSGIASAQERVTSYWLGAQSGNFSDAFLWSGGVPNNTGETLYDVVIDSEGDPYTVLLEFDSFTTEYWLQSLTLNSADATFEIKDRRYSGGLYIEEEFVFTAGTLRLKDAFMSGVRPHTRMQIGPDARFEFTRNRSSQDVNYFQNFDVYGGDLVIENSALLDITGTHVKEGSLVFSSLFSSPVNTNSIIDFDILFENGGALSTNTDGLVIKEGVTIQGNAVSLGAIEGRFPNYTPASFINHGTVTLGSGESTFTLVENYGTVEVYGGELNWRRSDNHGTVNVRDGAEFTNFVTNNGTPIRFHNSGIIDVSGKGTRYETTDSFITGNEFTGSYWSNSGTLRVTDHARARLGWFNISDLGNLERDATARIEITGRVDLEGTTAGAATFGGETWLTYDNPGGSGGMRGELRNGRLDLSGDWLKFSRDYGYLKDIEIVGGDFLIEGDPASYASPLVTLDNVTVSGGGIVLGSHGHVGFGSQSLTDDGFFFNSSIRTTHRSGVQSEVSFNGGNLHLGESAYVTGNLDFGRNNYTYQKVINDGIIISTNTSGRLEILATLDNHGVVASSGNTSMTFRQLNNFGSLLVDNALMNGWSVENTSFIDLAGTGRLNLSGVFIMLDESELNIDALMNSASIVASFGMTLGGTLNLDLSRIDSVGIYTLFESQAFEGDFDVINISGLDEQFEFGGFDSASGTFTVVPSPAGISVAACGGLIVLRRRRS